MALKTQNTSEYKKISLGEAFAFLEATENGLSDSSAQNRLKTFGYNEIVEKKRAMLLEFLLRYWGPMPWLLELAMGLSFILRHYIEGGIIFVLLTMNAVIGHLHSRGSQKAIELLKKKLAIDAKVLRDGQWVMRKAIELVPGDIFVVKLGDIVPADAKIINGEISVDESALTGESLPKDAHQSDIIYSSSVVKRGKARCLIINTGADTFFGKTAELVKIAKPKSHQEEVMMAVVKYMLYVGIAASIFVALYALFLQVSPWVIFTFIVIFLMGAVPVALPAVMTIVQSVGAMELAKQGVLVTRLDSIEDAASIDVICFDKTGTITRNKLSVIDCVGFCGNRKAEAVALAAAASQAEGMELIDLAIIEYAKNSGADLSNYKQIAYTPFNPAMKRTEAVVEIDGKRSKVLKGASQTVLSLCRSLNPETVSSVNDTIINFSRKGYRTIAVARSHGDDPNDLQLAGLLALADPPRPDSKNMIETARELGIKPIMLTGDSIAIAQEIARQVGIGNNVIRFADIKNIREAEQIKIVEESDGFAEIYPEDKYKIVKLLQSQGHMVGMTGDGVNDAPALKQAEMGIAVNNATDVAKAAASVVLTEPGIQVIIDAVTISRKTYQRMLTWVINKVTKVIEFVGVLTLSFFWLHDIVLSLLGMSLLVFSNDFVTMSLATDNAKHTSNPNQWNVKNITLASLIPGMLLVVEGMIVIIA
ncbi:MAG: plasma-membrane proton-efflux P-type ATPase, partial [Candidatus Omnitrophica bacterium]|nr:plasma-membrane proton-efflux P-type ATPase [Candidatus Omnitrophota bacterium]